MAEGCSTSARQTLYCLSKRYRIDVCAPSAFGQCVFSSRARRWRWCPRIGEDPGGYLQFLVGQLRRRPYDVLLPTNEEVLLLSRFREQLAPLAGLAVPPYEAVRKLQSKIAFTRVMQETDLPIPETHVLEARDASHARARLPCFLKLDNSTASLGVRYVENHAQLLAALEEFAAAGWVTESDELVLQQPAQGVFSVVQAVFCHGRLVAHHCTESLDAAQVGSPMLRVGASHPPVAAHLRSLGRHLGWHGALFLEYFYDQQTHQPVYIEANPRIGEVVNAWLSGTNLPELLVRLSRGEACPEQATSRVGVRSHTGFLWLLSLAQGGANRRQIWRHWRNTGKGRNDLDGAENELTRVGEDWISAIPAGAVVANLIARPKSARRIWQSTVRNYAVNQAAVARIEALDTRSLPE